jgi:RNA polymerase sigma factor (sigma-70 family)
VQTEDQSCQLQLLLDRIQAGDRQASAELVNRAYDRLQRLTRKIFHQTFRHLANTTETASILDQAALELLAELQQQEISPADPQTFFRAGARAIRNVLRRKDYLRRERGHETIQGGDTHDGPGLDPAAGEADPSAAAMWAEFHVKVEQQLPDDLLRVVDLHFYNGLTQAEIAFLMGISQPQVSRLVNRARLRLADWLPGDLPEIENS